MVEIVWHWNNNCLQSFEMQEREEERTDEFEGHFQFWQNRLLSSLSFLFCDSSSTSIQACFSGSQILSWRLGSHCLCLISQCPKWNPFPCLVHYFRPGPMENRLPWRPGPMENRVPWRQGIMENRLPCGSRVIPHLNTTNLTITSQWSFIDLCKKKLTLSDVWTSHHDKDVSFNRWLLDRPTDFGTWQQ